MQLGKKGKSNDLFEALKTEVGLEESIDKLSVGGAAQSRVPQEKYAFILVRFFMLLFWRWKMFFMVE